MLNCLLETNGQFPSSQRITSARHFRIFFSCELTRLWQTTFWWDWTMHMVLWPFIYICVHKNPTEASIFKNKKCVCQVVCPRSVCGRTETSYYTLQLLFQQQDKIWGTRLIRLYPSRDGSYCLRTTRKCLTTFKHSRLPTSIGMTSTGCYLNLRDTY